MSVFDAKASLTSYGYMVFGGIGSISTIISTYIPRPLYAVSKLEPVIEVPIFLDPTDVTEFAGDGEIWVGYGLRKDETSTEEDAFQDMMSNHRYYRLWQIGGSIEKNPTVCLTTTQMVEDTSTEDIVVNVPITAQ